MKNSIKGIFCKFGLILFLAMFSIAGRAQVGQYTMSISSATATSNTIDVSLSITVTNPAPGMRFGGFSTGINYNTAIVNGGTITASYLGGKSTELSNLNTAAVNTATAGQIRLPAQSLTGSNGVDMAQGSTLSLGTYRITNSVPWATSNASLWLQNVSGTGKTYSIVNGYPYGATTPAASYTTTITTTLNSVTVPTLILGYTQAAPYSLQVGQICATTGTAVVTNPSCFGATGSAAITLSPSPFPAITSVSYTVDGGATQTASVSGSSFTVSGLSTGTRTIAISVPGCSTFTVSPTVNVPTQLVASSSAGTIACNGGSTSVSVAATGGTAPYTGTGSFSVSAGAYSYTVTDSKGCTSTTTGTVSQPTALSASSSAGTIACNGGSTSVSVAATGGTAPYTGTGSFTVSAGAYSYTVTDANGCTSTTTGTVSQPAALSASSSAGTIACNGGTTSVTVAATGGTAPYSGTGSFTVSAGAYSYTVTDANGCTSTTTGTVPQPAVLTSSSTISACDTYTWSAGNGTAYTTSGTYTFTNTSGACPVLMTLNLTINHSSTTSETQVACDVYRWHGVAYLASGTYTYSSTNASGCTNVATLHLTINHSTTTSETQVACTSYTWNGVTYTTSGDYTFTSTNASGCDNVATLHLTINNGSTTSDTQTACDSYTWNGVTYTASGTYTYTSSNASGCPNVATLHLTINNSTTTSETQVGCGSYTWNGTVYTTSGDYTFTSTNASGCPNVATLHLTINSNLISSQPVNPTICALLGASASVSVGVSGASASTTYQWYSQAATSSTLWTSLVNNTNYAGVTGSTLTITRTTTSVPPAGTKYRVIVSGDCGTATSTTVALQNQTVLSKATAITAKSSSNVALLPALTTCEGSSLNLTLATGSIGNIQWMISTNSGLTWTSFASYTQTTLSVANGILAATSPTLSVGSAWFKVVASNGVCNSVDSTILKITVSAQPVAGTITGGNVTVCLPLATGIDTAGNALVSPITNSTVLTLGGSTNVGTIVWQKCINYTAAIPTWAAVANLTATTAIGASYSGAGTTALTVGNLAADTWYRVQVKNGACVDYTAVVKITVSKAAKAGVIASAATVCFGGNILFTSAAYTGTSIQWEVSTVSTTAGFVPVSGETNLTFNMTGVTYAPLSKFYVRTTVTSGSCTLARSAVKTITVNPTSVGGTVSGGGTVCSSGVAGTLNLAGNTGTIQWQYSADGTSYTNVPVGSATAPSFGTTSANGTAATYVVTNLTSATYFRALVTSGACSSNVSNAVQYVVGSSAIAGTISAVDTTICPATGTTLILTGSLGRIVWQKSVSPFTTWTNVTTSVTPTLSTGSLTATTQYRTSVTIGSCSTVVSNPITITVTAAPLSKGITANVTSPVGAATTPICLSSATVVKTISATAGYVGSIQWQSSTTSATAGFNDIAGETGTSYTVSNAIAGANYFRAKFTNACGTSVFSVVLTIYYKNCSVVKQAAPVAVTESTVPFGVVAYPNPSSESFNFTLTSSSEERVNVMVYDMTGKLIDQREVTPTEVSELQVGDRYPSGVYNVIVTQGENAKTLRVIKR